MAVYIFRADKTKPYFSFVSTASSTVPRVVVSIRMRLQAHIQAICKEKTELTEP